MTRHTLTLGALVLSLLFVTACGGESSPTAPSPPPAAVPVPPPPAPLWTRSGSGPDVFSKPMNVTRLHIVGTYGGRIENFVVRCDSSLLVNVILGTSQFADVVNYDGTHFAPACTQIEVKYALGVAWSLTEVR